VNGVPSGLVSDSSKPPGSTNPYSAEAEATENSDAAMTRSAAQMPRAARLPRPNDPIFSLPFRCVIRITYALSVTGTLVVEGLPSVGVITILTLTVNDPFCFSFSLALESSVRVSV
jgi:hypothetical protein